MLRGVQPQGLTLGSDRHTEPFLARLAPGHPPELGVLDLLPHRLITNLIALALLLVGLCGEKHEGGAEREEEGEC